MIAVLWLTFLHKCDTMRGVGCSETDEPLRRKDYHAGCVARRGGTF